MEDRNYYVYGYIRLDTNTYFYIGKGKEYSSCQTRYLNLSHRNKHFTNIINSVDCVVEILYNNLTDKEALELECKTIEDLVFQEGYSIEVKGNSSSNHYCHLVNQTWGGEGASGRVAKQTTKDKISKANKGNMNQYTKYFDGEQSVGELQEDGSYIIRISTDNYTNLWEGDL